MDRRAWCLKACGLLLGTHCLPATAAAADGWSEVTLPAAQQFDLHSSEGLAYRIYLSAPAAPPPPDGYGMGNALIKIVDALFFVVILHCIQVYQALPVSRDQAWIPFFIILEGAQAIEALIFGVNPLNSFPNTNKMRAALDKLDWLVCSELHNSETTDNWKRPGVDPKACKTEVFLLPSAHRIEKEGTISNSGRWLQWFDQGVKPGGHPVHRGGTGQIEQAPQGRTQDHRSLGGGAVPGGGPGKEIGGHQTGGQGLHGGGFKGPGGADGEDQGENQGFPD